MKIELYAPVDCTVADIAASSDPTFANKIMGDGLVIKPKSSKFYSPLKNGEIKLIFETKHAFFFEHEEINLLMHIGVNTVSMGGEPFNVKALQGDALTLNKEIVDVDLKKINEAGNSDEVLLIFDNSNIKKIDITIQKQTAKKGELIAVVELEKVEEKVETSNQVKTFKSKYRIAAEEILQSIGGFENYSKVYNCMTRLRFNINDKQKVNLKAINANQLVKGTNYAGDELQIIIGGDVAKVKEQVVKIKNDTLMDEQTKNLGKKSFKETFFGAVSGIISPVIPMLIAVALTSSIQTILVQLGVISNSSNITGENMFGGIMFILSKVGLNLIGVAFCYSTIKYFSGNVVLGLLVSLTLVARFFYSGSGLVTDLNDANFGEWVNADISNIGRSGWLLFKIGNYPILLGGYENSVLPFIMTGIMVVILDKWIKSWISPLVDIVFRPFLVYTLTFATIFFIFGPTLLLVEFGLSKFIILFENIPFGIGLVFIGLVWQVLVLTGTHQALVMSLKVGSIYQGLPSAALAVTAISVIGQFAAGLGILIITRNRNFRSYTIGATITAFFGITEPVIYGANLPKGKPFVAGCIGTGIGGFFVYLFGIKSQRESSAGIFSILRFDGKMQWLFILTISIVVALTVLMTMLTYEEKWDEIKYSKRIFKKIKNACTFIARKQNLDVKPINEKIDAIGREYFENLESNKDVFKDYMKYLLKQTKFEQKLSSIKAKEDKILQRLYKKAIRAEKSTKLSDQEKTKIIDLYNNFNLDDKRKNIEATLNEMQMQNIDLEKKIHSDFRQFKNWTKKTYSWNWKINQRAWNNGFWKWSL